MTRTDIFHPEFKAQPGRTRDWIDRRLAA